MHSRTSSNECSAECSSALCVVLVACLDSVRLLLGLAVLIYFDTLSRVRGSKMAAAGNGVRRMEGELRIGAW